MRLIKTKFLPLFLILISLIFLLIRARYSFCWSDESFYFATCGRFFKGDSIFMHDWFPTQLSSIALLPLYSLFVKITGSTAGIILYFRILFAIFECITAIVVFSIISKHHGAFLGCVTALLTEWYVHLNIATLSYYTLSLLCSLLAMLIIYDCYKDAELDREISAGYCIYKKSPQKLLIAGILFAISVLALPTMVVPYILVVILGFLIKASKKVLINNKTYASFVDTLDFIHIFKWTFVGILIPAVIFFSFLLLNVSVKDFIKAIPYVLSDEEHTTSLIYPIKRMYLAIMDAYGSRNAKAGFLLIAICCILFILVQIKKAAKNERVANSISKFLYNIRPFILLIDLILFAVYTSKSYNHTGFIFTAITLFSLPLFLITEKKNWPLFILCFVYGLTFSLVYSYSSFCDLYVLSMGHFIASIGGIILVYEFFLEICDGYKVFSLCYFKDYCKRKNLKGIFASLISYTYILILCISILVTVTLRITNIYRDDTINNLTVRLENGPAKGLYTSKDHAAMYNEVYEVISTYCMKDDNHQNLLISKLLPFGYMISDMNIAAPSTWRNAMDSDRVREYYKINPDKEPDTILLLNSEYGSYETCGDVEKDPSPNENSEEGFIYDFIEANNYTTIPVDCGIVYQKP